MHCWLSSKNNLHINNIKGILHGPRQTLTSSLAPSLVHQTYASARLHATTTTGGRVCRVPGYSGLVSPLLHVSSPAQCKIRMTVQVNASLSLQCLEPAEYEEPAMPGALLAGSTSSWGSPVGLRDSEAEYGGADMSTANDSGPSGAPDGSLFDK